MKTSFVPRYRRHTYANTERGTYIHTVVAVCAPGERGIPSCARPPAPARGCRAHVPGAAAAAPRRSPLPPHRGRRAPPTGGGRRTPPRGPPGPSQQPPDTPPATLLPGSGHRAPPLPGRPVPAAARAKARIALPPPHPGAEDGAPGGTSRPLSALARQRRGGCPAPARLRSRLPAARPPLTRHPALPPAAEQPRPRCAARRDRGWLGGVRAGRGEGKGRKREGKGRAGGVRVRVCLCVEGEGGGKSNK